MSVSSGDEALLLNLSKDHAEYLLREILRRSSRLMVGMGNVGPRGLSIEITPDENSALIFQKLITLLYPTINPEDITAQYFGGHADINIATLKDYDVIKELTQWVKEVPYLRNNEEDKEKVHVLNLDPELEQTILNIMRRDDQKRANKERLL